MGECLNTDGCWMMILAQVFIGEFCMFPMCLSRFPVGGWLKTLNSSQWCAAYGLFLTTEVDTDSVFRRNGLHKETSLRQTFHAVQHHWSSFPDMDPILWVHPATGWLAGPDWQLTSGRCGSATPKSKSATQLDSRSHNRVANYVGGRPVNWLVGTRQWPSETGRTWCARWPVRPSCLE